jgi:hypothetical protein
MGGELQEAGGLTLSQIETGKKEGWEDALWTLLQL